MKLRGGGRLGTLIRKDESSQEAATSNDSKMEVLLSVSFHSVHHHHHISHLLPCPIYMRVEGSGSRMGPLRISCCLVEPAWSEGVRRPVHGNGSRSNYQNEERGVRRKKLKRIEIKENRN